MKCTVILSTVLLLGLSAAVAQPAPRDTASVTLGRGQVTIEYGQPSLKGRSFDELAKNLPADRMWRAGSDRVTLFTTQVPLIIGGRPVRAGKYSVYIHCPEGGPFSFVLNRDQGQPLKNLWAAAPAAVAEDPYPSVDYANQIADGEVVRAPMKQHEAAAVADTLKMTLEPQGRGAVLKVAWGDQLWSLDLLPAPSEGSQRR